MVGSAPRGDAADSGFIAVSATVWGILLIVLIALGMGLYVLWLAISDATVSTGVLSGAGGGVGLGLALIGWDRLTDRFDASRPPGAGEYDEEDL